MNKVELLAPAGNIICGKVALDFGADAIYFGGKQYSLRARASNFDNEQLKQMINYAHSLNKKAYLVVNIICHNHLLDGFVRFFDEIKNADAFIVSDPYILTEILKVKPDAIIHISTQQSTTNSKAALFWKRNGAQRIISARELTLHEIKLMNQNIKQQIELEMFVHGAVCVGYSGRCMLSSNLCLRDANNGGCAQSCRWVHELIANGKVLSKTFTMSPKDMSLAKNMQDIINLQLTSIKIEGRMKTEHYIATVVNSYRKIIDHTNDRALVNLYIDDITKAANRETSTAWFLGEPSIHEMLYHETPKEVNQIFVFTIDQKIDSSTYVVTSRNYFKINDEFEMLGKALNKITPFKIVEIRDQNNLLINVVNTPMSKLTIKINQKLDLYPMDMARLIKDK